MFSSARGQSAPLAAVIAAIVVELNFDVRLMQFPFPGQPETDVFDIQPAVEPLLFVIGADTQNLIVHSRMIQVVSNELRRAGGFLQSYTSYK